MDFFDLFSDRQTKNSSAPAEAQTGACCCRLEQLPLAMSYVPGQLWGELYDPQTALQQGTLFPELDLPFLGKEARNQ